MKLDRELLGIQPGARKDNERSFETIRVEKQVKKATFTFRRFAREIKRKLDSRYSWYYKAHWNVDSALSLYY